MAERQPAAYDVTDISLPILGPPGHALAVLTCPLIRRIDRHIGPDLGETRALLQQAAAAAAAAGLSLSSMPAPSAAGMVGHDSTCHSTIYERSGL